MTEPAVNLEARFKPRKAFLPFHRRSQRRAILVVHRRGGKTVSCIIDLVAKAMECKKPDGRFAYIGPYANQTVEVAWGYLKEQVRNIPNVDIKEAKKQVHFVNKNGLKQQIALFGADKPDALRGLYFDGIVLDEVANMKKSVWTLVIQPALIDRKGWAVFIGTPNGKGFFWHLLEAAKKKPETWFTMELKASESGLLDAAYLEEYRQEVDEDTYMQEMECSFLAGVRGAIWSKELTQAEQEGRLEDFPVNKSMPVHLALDIGRRDATCIWYFQLIDGEVRVVDFDEFHDSTAHIVMPHVLKKGYKIGNVWMPRDGLQHYWVSERNASTVVASYGVRVRQVPEIDLEPGIQAVRHMLKYVRFAGERCKDGLESLRSYKRREKPDGGFSKAAHDDSSHAADAFRYLCLAIRDSDIDKSKAKPAKKVEPVPIEHQVVTVPGVKVSAINTTNTGWTFDDFFNSTKKRSSYQRI